jgi:aminoglycoside phosphotransferase (APT) family kinase protein
MEYVRFPVWKARLRQGEADPRFAREVGRALAAIHSATAGKPEVARRFATDAIFHAIRLEPYLAATGDAHPDLKARFLFLLERTARTKACLVHGDVSPKNILVGGNGAEHFPIFLDAECAWYGDPAFDLAFCLKHLLLKCLWVPASRGGFLDCFDALASGYLGAISLPGVEERTAALLPALLLARVDGKSPVEYLTAQDKDTVRSVTRELLARPPATLDQVRHAWQRFST